MANQRILLKHKLVPDESVVIASRLGDKFHEPNTTVVQRERFHDKVYNAWLGGRGEEHYDQGYYIELEI